MIAREKYKGMRENTAATKIQKLYRRKKKITGFRNAVYLVLRQHLIEKRRLALEKRRQEAILIIQKWTKRWLAKLHYKRFKRGVIVLQAHFRAKRVRKHNKIQKGEAIAAAKMRLERELRETQEKLAIVTQEKENTQSKLADTQVQLEGEKVNVKEKSDNVSKLTGQLTEVTSKYTQLKQVASLEEVSKAELAGELESLKKNFENVVTDLEKIEKSLAARNNDYYVLEQQKKALEKELEEMKRKVQAGHELYVSLEQVKRSIEDQLSTERQLTVTLKDDISKLKARSYVPVPRVQTQTKKASIIPDVLKTKDKVRNVKTQSAEQQSLSQAVRDVISSTAVNITKEGFLTKEGGKIKTWKKTFLQIIVYRS